MKRIETATHALTILFGLTSLANVHSFLVGAGHDPIASWALSGALGAALIVVSIALTKIDATTEQPTFRALVAVGLALGIISGALQSSTYGQHLGGLWPYLLGYGVPLVGEVGLSLASALFSKAQRRSELRAVNAKIEAAIITNLDNALADFDPTQIQRRIDRTLNRVAVAAVSGVESNLLALYGAPQVQVELPLVPVVDPPDTEMPAITRNVPTTEELTAIRIGQKAVKMDKTLQLIRRGDLSLGAIATEIGVTPKTIGRYVEELRSGGYNIAVNGVCKLA